MRLRTNPSFQSHRLEIAVLREGGLLESCTLSPFFSERWRFSVGIDHMHMTPIWEHIINVQHSLTGFAMSKDS